MKPAPAGERCIARERARMVDAQRYLALFSVIIPRQRLP